MTSTVQYLETAGGRIRCLRCRAKSKRTGVQCKAPATSGKFVCRFHGSGGRGAKTAEGRARCAAAKTIHGQQTRAARRELSEGLSRVRALEDLARLIGMIEGPRSPGRPAGRTYESDVIQKLPFRFTEVSFMNQYKYQEPPKEESTYNSPQGKTKYPLTKK